MCYTYHLAWDAMSLRSNTEKRKNTDNIAQHHFEKSADNLFEQ